MHVSIHFYLFLFLNLCPTYSSGGDMGQVGCDTRCVHNIEERELINQWRDLAKEG